MPSLVGTNNGNSWTIIDPGDWFVDGLGGVDTVDLGTSRRSEYSITQGPGGVVYVDAISSASGEFHLEVVNVEILTFNSRRETLDLRTFFGDLTPPTVGIGDNVPGTARGNIVFTLQFSEAVTGLAFDDFIVSHGSVLVVSGSGQSYSVTVAPQAGYQGTLSLTLNAAAVSDAAGNALAAASTVTQAVDTLAPSLVSSTPAANAVDVGVGSAIVLNFSEAIARGSGLITLKNGLGATVAQWDMARAGESSLSGSSLTLQPTAPLPAGSSLTLDVASGAITDLVGNPLAPPSVGSSALLSFGTAAASSLLGGAGDDLLALAGSTASVDGLGGLDTVVASGARSAYTLAPKAGAAGAWTLHTTGQSVDLLNVERLQFADGKLALDLDASSGRAAQVAMLLGAVFGREFVANQAFVGIGLNLLDGGWTFDALMNLALNFKLGVGYTNGQEVDLLYTNVVGVAPDTATKAYFVGLIENGTFTQVSLAILAATIPLNQSNVDLVGLQQTGLAYS